MAAAIIGRYRSRRIGGISRYGMRYRASLGAVGADRTRRTRA
jgi:hypothetical protein